jgi:hypothetical protein
LPNLDSSQRHRIVAVYGGRKFSDAGEKAKSEKVQQYARSKVSDRTPKPSRSETEPQA